MWSWSTETESAAATEALGALLGELLPERTTVWLRGELGAGKTCLVRGLARGLGVPASEPVTSPTYALMNLYRGRWPLRHFDLYRLHGPGQLEEIGLLEALTEDGGVVVEWAERAEGLTAGGVEIELCAGDDEDLRRCRFTTAEPALEPMLEELARRWRQQRGGDEGL